MTIPIVNSRELPNTWRILDDKLGTYGGRGLPFKFPYVGSFSQSIPEWFIRVYTNPGDTVMEPFGGRGSTAMQALWHGRNILINDLSCYSNTLCHSVLYVPYMKDVVSFIDSLEIYIDEDVANGIHNISTDYAGKGSENDVAKIYRKNTFERIIRLRNLLNSRNVLLGGMGGKENDLFVNTEWNRAYRHEIVMFTRMIMSQLVLYGSRTMSFNGMPTRGADNTNIKSILKFYNVLKESPKDVNIFDRMRYYANKMGLDKLGVKDKFDKLQRKLISCDARSLDLPDKCADMVVTSPPYFAVLNYGMANWLRIFALGGIGDPLVASHINNEIMETKNNSEVYGKVYDKITDIAGGTVDNPSSYSNFTGHYLRELYRVLKDDAVAIIVVGDYGNKKKVDAWKLVADRAAIFGFKPKMVIMD